MRNRILLPSFMVLLWAADFGWTQAPEAPEVIPPAATGAPLTGPSLDFDFEVIPPTRFWFQSEYLLWWVKENPLPSPLVVGPSPTLAISDLETGAIFFRPSSISGDLSAPPRHGGRFSAGYWFDSDQTVGIEGSYFFLGEQSVNRTAAAPPGSFLASPIAVSFAAPGVFIPGVGVFAVGGPGASALAALDVSSSFQGAEVNGVYSLFRGASLRLGLIGGFRWFELEETLRFTLASRQAMFIGTGSNENGSFEAISTNDSGQVLTLSDRFATNNSFFAGQIGTRADFTTGRWTVSATGKVALGSMRQTIEVAGTNTAFTNPIFSILADGGVFAQPPNLGRHTRNRFAVAPEVAVNVGYQITESLRASMGYSLLYVNEVVRPGDQMQTNLDVTAIFNPQVARPLPPTDLFHSTDFWAQGLTFGLEFRY
jgi:hypothetical protein